MSPDLLAVHPALPDCNMGCGRDATVRYGNIVICARCALLRNGERPASVLPLPAIDREKALKGFCG